MTIYSEDVPDHIGQNAFIAQHLFVYEPIIPDRIQLLNLEKGRR